MSEQEKMTVDERYKYLRLMHQRYHVAHRRTRGQLLDEAQAMTGLNRKYLCHLLNHHGPIRKPRTRQRGPRYSGQVLHAVAVVAEALDWVCAERLKPVLRRTAEHLAGFGELHLSPQVAEDIDQLSISTLYRMLKRLRQHQPRLPQRRGRSPTPGIAAEIPATRLAWNLIEPGHFELDLVHHCGPEARRDYVCTLQWIDVATQWSERTAVYGRSSKEMIPAFTRITSRCPFPILEIHPDNGAEFLNRPLLGFFKERVTGVKLTRSRPYQRNDNRFVEQKNHTLVRAYLGHARLDTRQQCALLNQIYEAMWVYYNLFQPVLHQKTKSYERTPGGQVKLHRTHDVAQTPYQRVLATGALSLHAQEDLEAIYQITNPLALRREIQTLLDALFTLAFAPAQKGEDIPSV